MDSLSSSLPKFEFIVPTKTSTYLRHISLSSSNNFSNTIFTSSGNISFIIISKFFISTIAIFFKLSDKSNLNFPNPFSFLIKFLYVS